MRDRLTEAIKQQDVEYADIRVEDKTSTWVNFRGPDLDTIGSARTVGASSGRCIKAAGGMPLSMTWKISPSGCAKPVKPPAWSARDTTYFAPS